MNRAAGHLQREPNKAPPPQSEIDRLLELYRAGQLAELVRQGEALAAHSPNSLMLHNVLGAACIGLRDFAKAEAAFRNAIAVEDGHAELYNNLGAALDGQNRFGDAIAAYRRAVTIDPGHASAHYNQAMCCASRGPLPRRLPATSAPWR
jgi:Flp pilus assembly protein TadD